MKGKRVKIAVAGSRGLEDVILGHFGHAKTFTIIEVVDGKVERVEVLENPAYNLSHGRGRVVAEKLAELGVDIVVTTEIGPGAIRRLKELGIEKLVVAPGKKVKQVLEEEGFI